MEQGHRDLAKAWDKSPYNPFGTPPAPPAAVESLVLRADYLEGEKNTAHLKGSEELAGAQELYRQGDHAKAEKIFHSIAENTANAPQVAEEARFYEAECLLRQERFPKAADTYNKQLTDFPSGMHRDQAVERMFEIANFWLEDTREEIRLEREQKEGKRWFVWHGPAIHFEPKKPLFDQEGRAVEKLEQVAWTDLNGPRADEALFLLGSIRFYREDYKEADRFFTQLVESLPRSKYSQQAMEYALISKHMSTGGPEYDGRKVAEARKFVDQALRNYVLPEEKKAFMERQLAGINRQQAEKDFKIAEFYERTNHFGAAYFSFEIVCRRYRGTPFAEQAALRMKELKVKMDNKPEKGAITLTSWNLAEILK
jgi:outer membrane protein assembly factor BamD (BamD/ComL family)